jgi:NAD(P)-dependent dehydrogenase (short-subunit alcohol dehydrogenase family)
MSTAIITGASRGLGLALAEALASRHWALVLDARGAEDLESVVRRLSPRTRVRAIPGSVADARHREQLIAAAGSRIDLLVNNASTLGVSPRPALADYPLPELREVFEVNVLSPLVLAQSAIAHMPPGATIVNVSSDAAVEPYPGWGGYGASKAALEQLTAILAAEHPALRIHSFDPGDMRTRMHQDAFPGEDISDRPLPEARVPALLALIEDGRPSGRYRARELTPAAGVSA